MWNYVKMEDGIWYAMDVTWDDLDGKYGREVKYDYFLRGSKSFSEKHTPESDYKITHFEYPELSETDYVLTTGPKQTTTTTTTTAKDVAAQLWGDANVDGNVELADAILVMQSIASPNKYGVGGSFENCLTEQGRLNGDVDGEQGLTGNDALEIQLFLLHKKKAL